PPLAFARIRMTPGFRLARPCYRGVLWPMTRSTDISPLSVLLSRVDAVSDGSPARETVPSGFPSLDTFLGGGFRRGDLVVLGGDVASGKSALALAFDVRG